MKPADVVAVRDTLAVESPAVDDIWAYNLSWTGYHRAHKERINKLDALVDGRWNTVWPDDTVTSDMPKVADFVTSDLEDITSLVGSVEPTLIVDPEDDSDAAQRHATMLQHILATYRRTSRMPILRRRLAQDLAGAGLATLVVWPDYSTGYPRFIRKDPRHVYPDPSLMGVGDEIDRLIVSYSTKARLAARAYPNITTELFTRAEQERQEQSSTDVTIVEYYDQNWCIKVAGRKAGTMRRDKVVLLAQVPNRIGAPLAMIACRPTWDSQFRGQFDKALGPLGTANRMMEMHLAQMADSIYSEKIVRGQFDNPQDVGPGATLYTTDYQASINRAETANSSPQMYNDIQLLLAQAREAAGIPAARHGDVDQSIATGSFVNAISGKYTTMIGNYQELIADLEQRANWMALAVDEAYLDDGVTEKLIASTAGGRSFTGTYLPWRDIAGHRENRVVYGAGASLDSYNRRIAIIQDVNYGLVSRRTGRAQLPYVGDVISEEADLTREQLEAGFITGLSDPATDIVTRARALAMLSQGSSVAEIATEFANEAMEAQRAAAVQQEVLGAPAGTGAPAGAPEEQPQLPSLAGLMGGGY